MQTVHMLGSDGLAQVFELPSWNWSTEGELEYVRVLMREEQVGRLLHVVGPSD